MGQVCVLYAECVMYAECVLYAVCVLYAESARTISNLDSNCLNSVLDVGVM